MTWDHGIAVSRVRVTPYDADDDPITLADVRDEHLRVTNDGHEDDYIASLMTVSLEMAQEETQSRILPETWRLDLSAAPCGAFIELPFPPLLEVEHVKYYSGGTLQTLSTDAYHVVIPAGSKPQRGRVQLVDGGAWPSVDIRPDAIQVTFRCGYADTSVSPEVVNVPRAITHGRLLVIKDLYENRGVSFVGPGNVVSPAAITAKSIWALYRDRSVAG